MHLPPPSEITKAFTSKLKFALSYLMNYTPHTKCKIQFNYIKVGQ